jgi:hypothetical protein
MDPGARLCILETIVPSWDHCADSDAVGHAIRDLNMFVLVGGQERTAVQYEQLLNVSGFTVTGITSGTACDVIEAVIQTASRDPRPTTDTPSRHRARATALCACETIEERAGIMRRLL